MVTTLDKFSIEDLSQIIQDCARHYFRRDHERRKVQCVTMFAVAINYQHIDKYMVHCPVSSHTYLLPVMLYCLKTQCLTSSYKSLNDLKSFRQDVIDFFVDKQENYQSKANRLQERILSKPKKLKESEDYAGCEEVKEEFSLIKYLCNDANDFPLEFIQVVVDFVGIAICVHEFNNANEFYIKPRQNENESTKDLNIAFDDQVIHLQLINEHYNLLTHEKNWQIDQNFLGLYSSQAYVPAYSLSKTSKKSSFKLQFAEQVQVYEFDKFAESSQDLDRSQISKIQLKA